MNLSQIVVLQSQIVTVAERLHEQQVGAKKDRRVTGTRMLW